MQPIHSFALKDGDVMFDDSLTLELMEACRFGHLNKARNCLKKGAFLSTGYDFALRRAAEFGHLGVVKMLVEEYHVHPEMEGQAALMIAAENGHLPVVSYLIHKGGDPHVENEHALRWAAAKGHVNVVQYLVEEAHCDLQALDQTALRWASAEGHVGVVQYLLDHGADISAFHDDALISAISRKHWPMVQLLIDRGASPVRGIEWFREITPEDKKEKGARPDHPWNQIEGFLVACVEREVLKKSLPRALPLRHPHTP